MGRVVPYFRGGLGNQLFQLAACLGYAEKYPEYEAGLDLYHWAAHPISHHTVYLYFDKFIHGFNLESQVRKVKNNLVIKEEKDGVYQNLPDGQGEHVILYGYFQTPLYFPSDQLLRQHFYLLREEQEFLEKKYHKLLENRNTVSIHIRRGDYLSFLKKKEHERVSNFIKQSITMAQEDIPEAVFIIFTNDKVHVVENMSLFPPGSQLINESYDYHEFWLMSQCRHHIVPNSTFAWWAMYLSPYRENYNYIITPWLDCFNGSLDIYGNLKDKFPKLKFINNE